MSEINPLRHLSLVADSKVRDLEVARRHRADLLRAKRKAANPSVASADGEENASPFTYQHALGRDGPDAA